MRTIVTTAVFSSSDWTAAAEAQARGPLHVSDLDQWKQISLGAPSMALPGVNFLSMVFTEEELGNLRPKRKKKKSSQELDGSGEQVELRTNEGLNKLLQSLLYTPYRMNLGYKNSKIIVETVPGHRWGGTLYGPERCKVMVIGKMLGRDESQKLRNLVGPAGQRLIEDLQAYLGDMSYESWYVTNLVKFLPPEYAKTLPKEWIKDFKVLLDLEIRLVQPDYILCLGAEAAAAVLPGVSITGSLGQVFDMSYCTDADMLTESAQPTFKQAKVVACIHPAAVLRRPESAPQLATSLRQFCQLVTTGFVATEEEDLHHIPVPITSARMLRLLIDRILSDPECNAISFDCEWHGDRPYDKHGYIRTIQFAWKHKHAAAIKLHHAGGAPAFLPSVDHAFTELARLFFSGKRLVGQNMKSDMEWLQPEFEKLGLDLVREATAPSMADDSDAAILTRTQGGFDTMLAAHAVNETGDFKLEVMAAQWLGIPRYDIALRKWKTTYCKSNGLKAADLRGYGECPDEILVPYGVYDADVTLRLFNFLNGEWETPYKPVVRDGKEMLGVLDKDGRGQNSRAPFWIAMRALPAFLEMEKTGVCIDMARASELHVTFKEAYEQSIDKLRQLIKWPTFNPASSQQCIEYMFGESYHGKVDKDNKPVRLRPPDAECLGLTPLKTTDKPPKTWDQIVRSNRTHLHSPATDKEVLGILSFQEKRLQPLLDLRFVEQVLKTTLREPTVGANGEETYEEGFLSFAKADTDGVFRIRSHLYPTLETGRTSSSKPNMLNLGKRREKDYKRILGPKYKWALRSIVQASPGCVLVEADYVGAELAVMAWMSDDPLMKDHVRRMQLPENHQDYYDIHSAVACKTFKLDCPATKAGIESIGKSYIRTAAKTCVFGSAYGQGPEALARKAKEEGAEVTAEDAQKLLDGFFDTYSYLPLYFESCRNRVRYPGWMKNCFGRLRRFDWTSDKQAWGEQKRQAMNFPKELGN